MSEKVKGERLTPLAHNLVKLNNFFWAQRQKTVFNISIPYQYQALNDSVPGATASNAIKNFRIAAGEMKEAYGGRVFQDSDVYKWLEAVGYYLGVEENPELESIADEIIDLIQRAQQEDGYVNTYFTVAAPLERWNNLRDLHELYCAGHMIEAAVAYYHGTGKTKFLTIACRFADYIETVFGSETSKKQGYDGHEEIELALVKLFKTTGEERYLALSKFFIDERGMQPHFFDSEEENRKQEATKHDYSYYQAHMVEYDYAYFQAHQPVREQETADGHAVRAMYLYSGMMDIAIHTGDGSLYKACKKLWNNIVSRRMYVTGGIGSIAHGEAFTYDYDLPNDKAYTETCAAIGLVFFAQRMLHYEVDREYADVIERVLYNGALSGISLDGTKYFYVNPLEVWPESIEKRKDNYKKRLRSTRQEWYGTACCPPNIARLISSLGHYMYSSNDREVYAHLYIDSEANVKINGRNISIIQKTNYPWDETIQIQVNPENESEKFTFALRIPGWCRQATLSINGKLVDIKSSLKQGYVYLDRLWKNGDSINLQLAMPIEKIQANVNVRVNAGKMALQRGPVVYCLEEVDNGSNLPDISISQHAEFSSYFDHELLGGVTVIETEGKRVSNMTEEDILYKPLEIETRTVQIKAVPYFAWCNRTPGEMLVWIRRH
ncbi:glycoside hydrolase family 127 protein [Metabacillus bambusae]|uniref:Glycoside hydrolase family 127 protein n=1 Tax=Metabacillus bambusae TaxID=2795218 RepID=A0ABS3N813_9BACI|nr:beta-L-arabinofuranosidase domain-containing protein [Metabacillus bambusae]MBO1514134.1 glycoside hydrolase family 127 protein [Metabacillus bambusae]